MEKSGFFNSMKVVGQSGTYSPTYNADDFSRLYRKTIGNGVLFDDAINDVINSNGEVNGDLVNDLKVSASGNNIIIAEGTAILQGYWYNNDAELQIVTGVIPSENFMIALVLDTTIREIKATKTTWTSETPAVPEGNENNYVLPLATVSVDSSGGITVTDVRQFVTNSMKVVNEINKSLISKVTELQNKINEINNSLNNDIEKIKSLLDSYLFVNEFVYSTPLSVETYEGAPSVSVLLNDTLKSGKYLIHFEFDVVSEHTFGESYVLDVQLIGTNHNGDVLWTISHRQVVHGGTGETHVVIDRLLEFIIGSKPDENKGARYVRIVLGTVGSPSFSKNYNASKTRVSYSISQFYR